MSGVRGRLGARLRQAQEVGAHPGVQHHFRGLLRAWAGVWVRQRLRAGAEVPLGEAEAALREGAEEMQALRESLVGEDWVFEVAPGRLVARREGTEARLASSYLHRSCEGEEA